MATNFGTKLTTTRPPWKVIAPCLHLPFLPLLYAAARLCSVAVGQIPRSTEPISSFPDFQGLESPWKQTWSMKVLESVSEGPWKCLNSIFYNAVTEEVIFRISVAWIWVVNRFCSNWIQWQLLMHLLNFSDNSSFWLMLEGVKLSNVNWTCLYTVSPKKHTRHFRL